MTVKLKKFFKGILIEIPGMLTAVIISLLFVSIIFLIFYIMLPKNATIFYEGETDTSSFTMLEDGRASFDIINELNEGAVVFKNDAKEGDPFERDIFVSDVKTAENTDFSNIDEYSYDKEHIFAFKNGEGLLRSKKFTLSIHMPDETPFSYKLEIAHADKSSPYWNIISSDGNIITISNFPKDAIIYLISTGYISTPGSDIRIPADQYQIINCSKIIFGISEQQNMSNASEIDSSLNNKIDSTVNEFNISNNNTGKLEFTVTSDTDYRNLGHVKIEGNSPNNNLTVKIDDLGKYPLPVQLEGDVHTMKVAGKSCYVNIRQWIVDNMTEILIAFITIMLPILISRNKSNISSD